MRTKTRYRIKSENIPVENNSPVTAAITAPPEAPAVDVAVESQPQPEPVIETESEAAREYEKEAAKADEAALALRKQLEQIRASEQLQRHQQAAQTALLSQQPLSREQKLDLWKSQGVPEVEINFLREHPLMVDFPEITRQAAAEAMQVHERDSAPYWETIEMNFEKHLANMQQKQTAAANPEQQAPAFFRPAPIRTPAAPSPANYVSAPVSREVPSGGHREPSLNQVRLSPEELEIARGLGISTTEYARGKLRLEKEKARGERQV